MSRTTYFGALLVVTLLLAAPALAGGPYDLEGSATFEFNGTDFRQRVNDDDVTGYFDQYEFTRNKDNGFPVEFGVSNIEIDLFGAEETPVLQFRFRSPTSNLSLSGDGLPIGGTFLNQRADLFARPRGIALDFAYRRLRTDEIRLFGNPTGVGNQYGSIYNDDISADDRFFMRRTGIGSELRLRPQEILTGERGEFAGFLSELAFRGGYEQRKGNSQKRYTSSSSDRGPGAPHSIRWRGMTIKPDQEVTDGGGGLVFAPGGLFTLAFDLDQQRFREDAPTIVQRDVNELYDPLINITGGTPGTISDRSLRSYFFIPDSDRATFTARLNARLRDRSVIHGGFQMSSLSQVGDLTPFQEIAGLRRNKVLFYSGNVAADVEFTDAVSANAFLKIDHRRNRLERATDLFTSSNTSQADPFIKRVRQVKGGAELVYRPKPMNHVALGFHGKWVDRRLLFAYPGTAAVPQDAILPPQTVIADETDIYTGYVRAALRPAAGLLVSGEVGLRNAPETGYIRELEDGGYFRLRGSHTFLTARPLTISVFGNGEFGENDDFALEGETPGNVQDQDFERKNFSYGATLAGSPTKKLTAFISWISHLDRQDFNLIRSNRRRFEAPRANTLDFFLDRPLDYRSDMMSVTFGGTAQLSKVTDVSFAYSFTRVNSRFQEDNITARTIDGASRIRSDIHGFEAEIGHWWRDGLRLLAAYRIDSYRERTPVRGGRRGVVDPFELSTRQHIVTVGATLTSALFGKKPRGEGVLAKVAP